MSRVTKAYSIISTDALLLAVAVLSNPLTGVVSALAQDWTLTSAPNETWKCVVSSADGNRLAAFSYSLVYISTNSGISWISNSLPSGALSCAAAASSADGSMLVAGDSCGGVYTSTNLGVTWITNNVPFGTWYGVASSADGSKLAAYSCYGNLFYTSTNAGMTWTTNGPPSTNIFTWCALASSADGRKLVAAGTMSAKYPTHAGWIYTSTNSGAGWQMTTAPKTNWCSITSSADGCKLVAAAYDDYPFSDQNGIFMSTNSGATWTAINTPQSLWRYITVACSTNGNNLIVAPGSYPGLIYTSTDSGATWISNNVPKTYWGSVASSAVGNKLAAAMYGGQIYTWQYKPTLWLSPSKTNLVVLWACSPFATNYVLQQNSDLSSANWTATGLPVNNDGTNMGVTFGPLIGNNYFRLFHP